jgi:hypothetical protein
MTHSRSTGITVWFSPTNPVERFLCAVEHAHSYRTMASKTSWYGFTQVTIGNLLAYIGVVNNATPNNKEPAMAATKTTARKSTQPTTIRIEAKGIILDVEVGQYRRIGNRRIGTAFLTVDVNGVLEYCNRRREMRQVSNAEFIQIFKRINGKVA